MSAPKPPPSKGNPVGKTRNPRGALNVPTTGKRGQEARDEAAIRTNPALRPGKR